jgi:hypothetical protein
MHGVSAARNRNRFVPGMRNARRMHAVATDHPKRNPRPGASRTTEGCVRRRPRAGNGIARGARATAAAAAPSSRELSPRVLRAEFGHGN